MPLSYQGQDIKDYVVELRDSGTAEDLAHAHRVAAMYSRPTNLHAFRPMCMPIPMIPRGDRWSLKDPADRRRVEMAAGYQSIQDKYFFDRLLNESQKIFDQRERLLPVPMPEAGVWVLLYNHPMFNVRLPAPPAAAGGGFLPPQPDPNVPPVDPAERDPVEWFFRQRCQQMPG